MDEFLTWFYAFMTSMLSDGVWRMISNFFGGLAQIFNLPAYFEQFSRYSVNFNFGEWVAAILAFILVYGIWAVIAVMIVLMVRKYFRFRKTIVGNEDLLEELADLHRDVLRLTKEKEKILAMKIGGDGLTVDQMKEFLAATQESGEETPEGAPPKTPEEGKSANVDEEGSSAAVIGAQRFMRLCAVDEKYQFYTPETYDNSMNLEQLCDDFRNFACSRMHLYYDQRTIRLMFAGLSSTKMILLQGISGTGKTSLPYSMGKYFKNDATIASVQPSWRSRSELLGYFNEFTKKYNETEVLRRIYESSYNDDINVLILDEMNIARVEYYFAEMLSILEMPDPNEWKLEIVPSSWPDDPAKLRDGKLQIPQNVWYVGTANNDDSTFSVSDKVYDRAFVINLDSKGVPFDAPDTAPKNISYSYVASLYVQAVKDHPVTQTYLDDIANLDMYVIEKFRIAFGNRIMKQLKVFVPCYVACGGEELDGIDHLLCTKVFRKFEGLNRSIIRDEIPGLVDYMHKMFGEDSMFESVAFLQRLQKMY